MNKPIRVVARPRIPSASIVLAATAGIAVLAFAAAPALSLTLRSGKDVVEAVCIECHGTGANGAPRIGDPKAWAERSARGLTA